MNGFLAFGDGRRVAVRHGLVIGRVAGCDLVLDDHKVSRRHAQLIVEGGVVEIEDLGSSNGTQLNGKAVQRRMLRVGDELTIGTTVLRYVEDAGAAPVAPGAAGAPPGAKSIPVEDDDELFGSAPAPVSQPARPAAAPPPPPPSAPVAAPTPPPAPRAPVPPAPPPAAPPPASRPAVIEFEDEVVELRKPAAPAAKPAAGAPAAAGPVTVQEQRRVLQFQNKQARGSGLLGDDLAQMSPGLRALLIGLAVVAALALGWLAMNMAS